MAIWHVGTKVWNQADLIEYFNIKFPKKSDQDSPPPRIENEVFIEQSFPLKAVVWFGACVFINCEFGTDGLHNFENCVFVRNGEIDDTLGNLVRQLS